MNVPFLDLAAHHAAIRPELDAALSAVIDAGAFAGGSFVSEFEHAFAGYVGASHAVGVSSGTDALWLALSAVGVEPGDEVITVPNSFIATAAAISLAGARPVFVDVDADTYTMSPEAFAAAITPRTKAVVPVHLFGHPAPMAEIIAVARPHGIRVVEDACQAHGARVGDRRVGAMGDAGCFSFYPGKNLGALGDGGAVTTNSREVAEHIRLLRDHGREAKNRHVAIGATARLDAIQAAVLSVKLRHLDAGNAARQRAAALYDRLVEEIDDVVRPFVRPGVTPAFHLYTLQAAHRDALLAALRERSIEAAVHYPHPIHLQPAYAHLGHRVGDFPIAERLAQSLISLPLFPEITPPQISRVVDAIQGFYAAEAALS